jgi:hypothetical protein
MLCLFIKVFKLSRDTKIMNDFDVVMPKQNEEAFIDMALKLGYKKICFLTDQRTYSYMSQKIAVLRAYLAKDPSEIAKARKNFDFVFANADRKFFESNVDCIINAELSDRKDSFHYRNTLLNQVHAKLAKENKITILFNFNLFLGTDKPKMLGRMMQNADIVRKYHLQHAAYSLAKTPYEMRSRGILDSLMRILSTQ